MNFSNTQETRRNLIVVLQQTIDELKDNTFDTVNGTMKSMHRHLRINSIEHQLGFYMDQLKRATIDGDTEQVGKTIGEIYKIADTQYTMKTLLPPVAE